MFLKGSAFERTCLWPVCLPAMLFIMLCYCVSLSSVLYLSLWHHPVLIVHHLTMRGPRVSGAQGALYLAEGWSSPLLSSPLLSSPSSPLLSSRTQRTASSWTWTSRWRRCAPSWPRTPSWRGAITPWASPRGASSCGWTGDLLLGSDWAVVYELGGCEGLGWLWGAVVVLAALMLNEEHYL